LAAQALVVSTVVDPPHGILGHRAGWAAVSPLFSPTLVGVALDGFDFGLVVSFSGACALSR